MSESIRLDINFVPAMPTMQNTIQCERVNTVSDVKLDINFTPALPIRINTFNCQRVNTISDVKLDINFTPALPTMQKKYTCLRGSVIPPELLPSDSEISSISQGTYRFDLCRGSFLFE